tara:strand:- start:1985 stop:3151 length:1167 start_codon:yes stop_codon:yes gene_type:complete
MPNNRIFYACQAVAFVEKNDQTHDTKNDVIDDAKFLTGVQSVGVSSSIPSRQLQDYGRIQRKYNLEGKREYTISISRVIDKNSDTFYKTASYGTEYKTNHLLNEDNLNIQGQFNSNNKCLKSYDVILLYTSDDKNNIYTDSQTAIGTTLYRSCLITSLEYEISVDGPVTETITLRSNSIEHTSTKRFEDTDITFPESGDVLTGEHLDTQNDTVHTKLPADITTLFASVDDRPILQSITINVDIEYEDLMDVGRWNAKIPDSSSLKEVSNLYSFVVVPVSVQASFTGVSRNIFPSRDVPFNDTSYQPDNEIKIVLDGRLKKTEANPTPSPNFFIWDLGQKNYVVDYSVSGGDAEGGNVELSLTYANQYSDFVLAPKEGSVRNITNTSTY